MKKKNLDRLLILFTILSLYFPDTFLYLEYFFVKIYPFVLIIGLALELESLGGWKGFLFFLPLPILSGLIFFVFKGASLGNNTGIITDYLEAIVKYYPTISLIFAFFLLGKFLENISQDLRKIFAYLSLLIFLYGSFRKLPDFLAKIDLKIYLYLFIFLIFSTRGTESLFIGHLFTLRALFAVMIYLGIKFKKPLLSFLGLLIIPYTGLKVPKKSKLVPFSSYFLASLLYLKVPLDYLLGHFLLLSNFYRTLASLLASFLLAEIFYAAKIKFLDYAFLGIHDYRKS